jgi:S-adenosylmethionine hydrolase
MYVYIDHLGNVVTNINKQFLEVSKGRPYETGCGTKNMLKTILPNYSAIASPKSIH